MTAQARTILWAQWRSLWNVWTRGRGTGIFSLIVVGIWYVGFLIAAILTARLAADAASLPELRSVLPWSLAIATLYWQAMPVVLASTGFSLDLRKLLPYPVPHGQLFALEVLLRVTAAADILLLVIGLAAGLLFNPALPWWAPLGLVPFVLFNLLLSAGLTNVIARLLARKRIREVMALVLVMAAILPRVLLMRGAPRPGEQWMTVFDRVAAFPWPWAAAAHVALPSLPLRNAALLLGWTALAYLFGRAQFERGIRFDAEAARAGRAGPLRVANWFDALFRWPSRVLPDPLAALIEKDLRFLSRSARFRMVFIMGFSFGLLVWLPVAFGNADRSGFIATNFLTLVGAYSVLLLGEVTIWNVFGFDRTAAQAYYATPVPLTQVLRAKNLTALFWILLELVLIIAVMSLFRLAISPTQILDAFFVIIILSLFLMALGNLTSVRYPRGINPSQSYRSGGAGKAQLLLLLIYPLGAAPLALAYGARYAFDSPAAFYGVLALDLIIGLIFYSIALESAARTAGAQREQILTALTQGEGPIAT